MANGIASSIVDDYRIHSAVFRKNGNFYVEERAFETKEARSVVVLFKENEPVEFSRITKDDVFVAKDYSTPVFLLVDENIALLSENGNGVGIETGIRFYLNAVVSARKSDSDVRIGVPLSDSKRIILSGGKLRTLPAIERREGENACTAPKRSVSETEIRKSSCFPTSSPRRIRRSLSRTPPPSASTTWIRDILRWPTGTARSSIFRERGRDSSYLFRKRGFSFVWKTKLSSDWKGTKRRENGES